MEGSLDLQQSDDYAFYENTVKPLFSGHLPGRSPSLKPNLVQITFQSVNFSRPLKRGWMGYERAVLTFEAWGSWVPERPRPRGSPRGPGRCRGPSPRWTCPAARTVRPPRSPTPSSGSPPRTSPSITAGSGASHLKRQSGSVLRVHSHQQKRKIFCLIFYVLFRQSLTGPGPGQNDVEVFTRQLRLYLYLYFGIRSVPVPLKFCLIKPLRFRFL